MQMCAMQHKANHTEHLFQEGQASAETKRPELKSQEPKYTSNQQMMG